MKADRQILDNLFRFEVKKIKRKLMWLKTRVKGSTNDLTLPSKRDSLVLLIHTFSTTTADTVSVSIYPYQNPLSRFNS